MSSVLMLENNSFDHILGSIAQVKKLDGIASSSSFVNSYLGMDYPALSKDSRLVTGSASRYCRISLVQMEKDEKGNDMGGFIKNYWQSYPRMTKDQACQVMTYYPYNSLPASHHSQQSLLCATGGSLHSRDRRGQRQGFAMSGILSAGSQMPGGIMDLNLHWYTPDDDLRSPKREGDSWKVYFGDVPVSTDPRSPVGAGKRGQAQTDAGVPI